MVFLRPTVWNHFLSPLYSSSSCFWQHPITILRVLFRSTLNPSAGNSFLLCSPVLSVIHKSLRQTAILDKVFLEGRTQKHWISVCLYTVYTRELYKMLGTMEAPYQDEKYNAAYEKKTNSPNINLKKHLWLFTDVSIISVISITHALNVPSSLLWVTGKRMQSPQPCVHSWSWKLGQCWPMTVL